jgi:manganese transport protein
MRKFGPGLLVTAAFIGPGTITTASIAGANFGLALFWALLFSVVTTMILQEMAARLGIVARMGLAEALRASLQNPWIKWSTLLLIILAIGFGNAAYQTGNLLGAAIGAEIITGLPAPALAAAIAIVASLLLASGIYRLVEGVLVLLVGLMSLVFIATLLIQPPDPLLVLQQLFPPKIPDGATLAVIALIGTTVVPYNLFLHANAVQKKWPANMDKAQALSEARLDLGVAISLGGLITLAIMATAASALFGLGNSGAVNAASIAGQLAPVLGDGAKYFVASGLLAAGLTSAITAPLAASFAVCGALGWPLDMQDRRFKAIWLTVMVFGAGFAAVQTQPLAAILIAQAANGMLLPVIAIALLWVMNQKAILGAYSNTRLSNSLGALVILVTLGLGAHRLASLLP